MKLGHLYELSFEKNEPDDMKCLWNSTDLMAKALTELKDQEIIVLFLKEESEHYKVIYKNQIGWIPYYDYPKFRSLKNE